MGVDQIGERRLYSIPFLIADRSVEGQRVDAQLKSPCVLLGCVLDELVAWILIEVSGSDERDREECEKYNEGCAWDDPEQLDWFTHCGDDCGFVGVHGCLG